MAEQLVPILKVADARRAAEWYSRLGFSTDFEYQYSPEFPAYLGVAKGDMAIHLSEHAGDATPDSLLYLYVDDVEKLAAELGADVIESSRAREIHLVDPDGNRIRIGTRKDENGRVPSTAAVNG